MQKLCNIDNVKVSFQPSRIIERITLTEGLQASSVFFLITVLLRWKRIWSDGGLLKTGEDRSTRKITSLGATLSTTNPTWNKLEWNQDFSQTGRWLTVLTTTRPFEALCIRFPPHRKHTSSPSQRLSGEQNYCKNLMKTFNKRRQNRFIFIVVHVIKMFKIIGPNDITNRRRSTVMLSAILLTWICLTRGYYI
jgi:hypothetical protein